MNSGVDAEHKHKYLFFKELALFRGQSVRFRDERDDIDFVMESLHELDVQRLQPGGGNRNSTVRATST